MKHFNLQTARCRLELIQQKHIEHIYAGLSNPQVTDYYAVHFSTLKATQEQMDWYANLHSQQTGRWWAITEVSSAKFCGAVGFNNWDKENRKAEIGCWLLPEYWGRGLMLEVFDSTLSYAFSKMNLNRVKGFVDSRNLKCKRALGKLKFEHEGTMRQCEIKNGAFLDVEIYAMLKTNQK